MVYRAVSTHLIHKAGYQLKDGKWEVALLGRNLTDEDVVTYSNPIPLSQSSFGVLSHFGTVEHQRNFALQASYRF